jgi:hypothetical protein
MIACIFLILVTIGLVLFLAFTSDNDVQFLAAEKKAAAVAPKTCPGGQKLVNNTCICTSNNKPPEKGKCSPTSGAVVAPKTCQGGQVLLANNTCGCPGSQILKNGKCVNSTTNAWDVAELESNRIACERQGADYKFDKKTNMCNGKGVAGSAPTTKAGCDALPGYTWNSKVGSGACLPTNKNLRPSDKPRDCAPGYENRPDGSCIKKVVQPPPLTQVGCNAIKGDWINGICIPKLFPTTPKGAPITSVGSFGDPAKPVPVPVPVPVTGGGDVPDAPPSGGRPCKGNQRWDIQKKACVDPKPLPPTLPPTLSPTKKPLVMRPMGSGTASLQTLADQWAKQMAKQG